MYMDSYARLPRPVLRAKTLTPAAKLVFQALHSYAWGEKEEAWPSIKRLASDTGLSDRGVQKALKQLEEVGLITIEHRKRAENPRWNDTNLYTLTYVDANTEVVNRVRQESRTEFTTSGEQRSPEVDNQKKKKGNKPIGMSLSPEDCTGFYDEEGNLVPFTVPERKQLEYFGRFPKLFETDLNTMLRTLQRLYDAEMHQQRVAT